MKKEMKKNTKRGIKSIRTRIIAGMSITAAAFVLLLGMISIVLSYQSANTQLKDEIEATAAVAADRVSEEIYRYINIAESCGMRKDIADLDIPIAEKKEILDGYAEKYGMVRANLLDSDGTSYFDGNTYADREYFQTCMEGNAYISTPVKSKVTGELTIIVAAPVWQNGEPDTVPAGVVYFVPEESFLNDIMASIKISGESGAYIIDKSGYTIADTTMETVTVQNIEREAEKDGDFNGLADIHKRMRQGEAGAGFYTKKGVAMAVGYAPIDRTDNWSLGLTAPKSEFMGMTILSVIVVAAVTFISIIISVIFARNLAGRIEKPLMQCTKRIQQLAEGDLHSLVPEIDTEDETGILASATREIVECLQSVIQDENRVLGEMASGNFTVSVTDSIYKGDLDSLRESLFEIIHKLSNTLRHINDVAVQVSAGSEQVAAGSQAFSQGATEQASSVEELAATLNEINRDIQLNAQSADQGNEAVDQAQTMLMKSREKMEELNEAMEEIRTSSGEIGHIIKTIEDIAFQTNILALNAAVEAARAGNAGKGFAVVADEVRSLAEKSAAASKSTSALIEGSVQSVERGSKLADETADCIEKTAEYAKKVVEMMQIISSNSKTQAESVGQVSEGVDQISNVVQTNSATAQQSAAASEELSGQAELLKKEAGEFKLPPSSEL